MKTEVPELASLVQSIEAINIACSSKDLAILYDPQSHELEIPDDLVLDNILSNLIEISSVLTR